MKKKAITLLKMLGILLLFVIIFRLFGPTWTPSIKGANSISELKKVTINGTELAVMIRGEDKGNPVLLFVHGGPCCSEIPYVRKYQESLEKNFTVVHYDQRGSGKSYRFGTDYSEVTTATHTEDLIALTEYITEALETEQVILLGHSFGTYIATMAAAQRPELYEAYVGIGQMSDTVASELSSLEKCLLAAEEVGNETDATYLKGMEEAITKGEAIAPRAYVRKYGFAARSIHETGDYLKGFLFGPEYNLTDMIRFYTAVIKYQDALTKEALKHPITDAVTELNLPVYFVMGAYDGMTSPETAEAYLQSLTGEGVKEFVLFDASAHYPQFEEEETFARWMEETFVKR